LASGIAPLDAVSAMFGKVDYRYDERDVAFTLTRHIADFAMSRAAWFFDTGQCTLCGQLRNPDSVRGMTTDKITRKGGN